MLEKDFQTIFGKWIIQNSDELNSSAFELKVVKGGAFNLNNWETRHGHQIRNLLRSAGESGTYHKISDQSMGQKPYDCFLMKNATSFLVIGFIKFHTGVMLKIHDVWPRFRGQSIKYEEALSIAFKTFKF